MLALEVNSSDWSAWEDELLREVCRTVKEVWVEAGRPKQVYIAVDGVVPMAKIRQQRVRRFKSAYLKKNFVSASSSTEKGSSWDSNSITPGTAFMSKLGLSLMSLMSLKALGKGLIVSTSDEPGEGEHKIMNWLRTNKKAKETICIYGLDADLILLSMLTGEMIGNTNLWLMREKQEFGTVVVTEKQEYSFMNLEEFKLRIGVKGVHEVLNYVGLMSLMGNDFLPHSLTHKLNDDGHDLILDELRAMRKANLPSSWLVSQGQGPGDKGPGDQCKLQVDVLKGICSRWAADEDKRILHMVRKKQEQAKRGVGRGMSESEGLPLQWNVEKVLMDEGGIFLKENWRSEYWNWIHPCSEIDQLCSEYIYGLQWILDYYTGQKEVNTSWLFPSWIPPLWSDLAGILDSGLLLETTCGEGVVIRPAEQLAMVLPLESWGLIQDKNLRRLPALAPQMWPLNYTFFSAGRKWLWECEARIPILTAERVREILKEDE